MLTSSHLAAAKFCSLRMSGAAGTAAGALSSIGSDLSISISFQVASELIEGGKEGQLRDDELVGIVLALAIVLTALRSMLSFVRKARLESAVAAARRFGEATWPTALACMQSSAKSRGEPMFVAEGELEKAKQQFVADKAKAAEEKFESERTILDFSLLFVNIATRISLSVTVQLLAAAARSRQSVRAARVLTLISLSVFFVYLEAGGDKRLF